MDRERLLSTFIELLRIDSPSGEEDAIAEHLTAKLQELGFRTTRDGKGNVLAWSDEPGDPILLNADMDNVSPCRGVQPEVREGNIVCTDGTTVLGGDDKAGIAAILEALASTQGNRKRSPEVLFTVEEEIGLRGSREVDASRFQSKQALVMDSGETPGTVTIQGPGQDSMRVAIIGKAAHAGVCPENGINAIAVASRAIARMRLGRIDTETTANIGKIQGGVASNIVPERVDMVGEARSRNEAKLVAQTRHMTECFEEAARDAGADVQIDVYRTYDAFNVPEDHPLVQNLLEQARQVGLQAGTTTTGGGTDGHWLCKKGITAVALGTGTKDVHSTSESINMGDVEGAARWLEAILGG